MTTILSRTMAVFALGATLLVAVPAAAQTTPITITNIQTVTGTALSGHVCPVISRTLTVGSHSSTGTLDVFNLQVFLSEHGFLSASHQPTNYFGSITRGGVIAFQRAYGVPATGVVGPLTRAAIAAHCNAGVVGTISTPTLSSMSPTQGPVGTTVTLTGSNFTGSNMVHFAYGAIQNVSSPDGTTLTFTVPTSLGPICKPGTPCPYMARLITPGDYDVYVENNYGTTTPKTFTVTDSATTATTTPSSPTALTVSRVNVPDTLMARTGATWTIYLANASAPLTWSADWGDETATSTQPVLTGNTDGATIASYAHVYQNAGNFQQVFNVTDGTGQKMRVVSSVTVTQNPNQI